MEWLVKNAVNRDVERQHLNKILQEIKATVASITTDLARVQGNGQQDVKSIVGEMVSNNIERGISVSYNAAKKTLDFINKDFTITLLGDVTGSATVKALGNVEITTELADGGSAPDDGQTYWQHNGEWEAVLSPVVDLQYLEGSGIMIRTAEDGGYEVRAIEGTSGEIDVSNGDGTTGNPTVSLADLADNGNGVLLAIERDTKGRVAGTKPVTAGTNVTITDIGTSIEIASTGGGGGSAEYDLGDSSDVTAGEFAIDLGGST